MPTATYYAPTGRPTADWWFVGSEAAGTAKAPEAANQVMANITLQAAQGEPVENMRMEVEKTGQPSPESRPATVRGIPSMGLIPIPTYLLLASPTGAIEKLSASRLSAQVNTLAKMLTSLDGMSTEQIQGLA
jgi:hypothetical protein